LKVLWVKTQDPTVFNKANIRAIANEKVWGHSENKAWHTRHFLQREGPSVQFFSEQRPTSFLAQLAFHATQRLGWHGSVSSTDQAKMQNIIFLLLWLLNGQLLESSDSNRSASTGLNLSSFVSMFVLTRALFTTNEILSAVSTELERKAYLAKMNYYPNTRCGDTRSAGPPEVQGPMQPHRLHWLKAGPGEVHQSNQIMPMCNSFIQLWAT